VSTPCGNIINVALKGRPAAAFRPRKKTIIDLFFLFGSVEWNINIFPSRNIGDVLHSTYIVFWLCAKLSFKNHRLFLFYKIIIAVYTLIPRCINNRTVTKWNNIILKYVLARCLLTSLYDIFSTRLDWVIRKAVECFPWSLVMFLSAR